MGKMRSVELREIFVNVFLLAIMVNCVAQDINSQGTYLHNNINDNCKIQEGIIKPYGCTQDVLMK